MVHEDFNDFLKSHWIENGSLESNIERVKSEILIWNKETFGLVER